MRYLLKILLHFLFLLLVVACASQYSGKYISTKVDKTPSDEFMVNQYVILSFYNEDFSTHDEWIYGFNIYLNNDKVGYYLLRPERVGKKRYYLKEVTSKGMTTKASFDAKPEYEHVKENLSNILEKRL